MITQPPLTKPEAEVSHSGAIASLLLGNFSVGPVPHTAAHSAVPAQSRERQQVGGWCRWRHARGTMGLEASNNYQTTGEQLSSFKKKKKKKVRHQIRVTKTGSCHWEEWTFSFWEHLKSNPDPWWPGRQMLGTESTLEHARWTESICPGYHCLNIRVNSSQYFKISPRLMPWLYHLLLTTSEWH